MAFGPHLDGASDTEPTCQETLEAHVQSLSWEDPLEKSMATHSSILAGRIPRTKGPGGLQFRVAKSRTQLSDLAQHRTPPPPPPRKDADWLPREQAR